MKIDIIGSIILTLILLLFSHLLHLDTYECIILMLVTFLVINYFGLLSGFWYNITSRLKRKTEVKKARSSYEDLRIDEE